MCVAERWPSKNATPDDPPPNPTPDFASLAVQTLGYDGHDMSTRSYFNDFITVYDGLFQNGIVSGVKPVGRNLTMKQAGHVNMGVEVSADGQTLFFSRAVFSDGSTLQASNLGIAKKVDGKFVIDETATETLKNINTDDLEYAASLSTDERELYFTRTVTSGAQPVLKIMMATRSSANEPFGAPESLKRLPDR